MSTEKSFKLIGSFEDRITAKLKKLNREIARTQRTFARLNTSIRPIENSMRRVSQASDGVARSLRRTNTALITTGRVVRANSRRFEAGAKDVRSYEIALNKATVAARRLNAVRQVKTAAPKVGQFDRGRPGKVSGSGVGSIAVGSFLGSGAVLAVSAVAARVTNTIKSAFSFVGDRFKDAVDDELSDIQAAGSLFGALRGRGLVEDFKIGRRIFEELDQAIGRKVATSPVPTDMVVSYARMLSDNLLPALMEPLMAQGKSAEKAAEESSGYLAEFYERMSILTPKGYSPEMVNRAMTKALEGESLSKLAKYDFFTLNPTFVDELEKLGLDSAKTLKERMDVFNKAMMTAVPPETMAELRTSLQAGYQGIADNLTNPTVGIFSFASRLIKPKEAQYLAKNAAGEYEQAVRTVSTPFQYLGTFIAPAMLELGELLSSVSQKMGPVTQFLVEVLDNWLRKPLDALTRNLASITSQIQVGQIIDFGSMFGGLAGSFAKFVLDALRDFKGLGKSSFIRNFSEAFSKAMAPGDFKSLVKEIFEALGDAISFLIRQSIPLIAGVANETIKTLFTKGGWTGAAFATISAKTLVVDPLFNLLNSTRSELIFAQRRIHKVLDFVDELRFPGNSVEAIAQRKDRSALRRAQANHPLAALKGALVPRQIADLPKVWEGMRNASGALDTFVSRASGAGKFLQVLGRNTFILSGLFAALSSAMRGEGLDRIAANFLGGGGGAMLGATLGFALAGPIGAAIGGVLGGALGTTEPALKFFQGVVQGTGEVLQATVTPLTDIFGSLWGVVVSAVGIVGDLVKTLSFLDHSAGDLGGEIDALTLGVAAVKIALFPLTATLHLLQIGMGALEIALMSLKVATLQVRLWFSEMNPFSDAQKQKALRDELNRAVDASTERMGKFGNQLAQNHAYYSNWFDASKQQKEAMDASSQKINAHGVKLDASGKLITDATKIQTAAVQQSTQQISQFTKSMAETSGRMSSLFRLAPNMTPANALSGFAPMGSAAGQKTSGDLGRFLMAAGVAPVGVSEHPDFGGLPTSGHAENSYHYAGRAIDIGAYAWEQAPILQKIEEFNQMYGVRPVELLHAGNDPDHADHIHVAYSGLFKGYGMPFTNWMEALKYERHTMPTGATPIYNSSETMSGIGRTVNLNGDIIVHADGNSNADEIANTVASKILNAVRKAETSTIS